MCQVKIPPNLYKLCQCTVKLTSEWNAWFTLRNLYRCVTITVGCKLRLFRDPYQFSLFDRWGRSPNILIPHCGGQFPSRLSREWVGVIKLNMGCPLPNGGRPRHTNRKIGGCIGVAALSQRKKHTAPTITVPDLPFVSSVAILLMPNIFWFLLVSLLLLNFFVLGNRSLFM